MRRVIQSLNAFGQKLNRDNVSPFAAEVTLFTVISSFPFLMFLFSLLSVTPISPETLEEFIDKVLPTVILPFVHNFLDHYLPRSGGGFTILTAIAFLWAGSKGFLSIEKGLNGIYSQAEQRNYFLRRFLSLVYTVVFSLFIILILVVFVFGNLLFHRIEAVFPLTTPVVETIRSSRTGITAFLLIILFTSIFKVIPNRRAHKTNLITELPGALIATVGWIGFSFLYSIYINNLSNFSAIYGSLTAVVLLLLWLYICMFIMFFGAEVNSVLRLYELRAKFLEKRAKMKAAAIERKEHLKNAAVKKKAQNTDNKEQR